MYIPQKNKQSAQKTEAVDEYELAIIDF